jgi:membrane-associated phospholipid phosphatase
VGIGRIGVNTADCLFKKYYQYDVDFYCTNTANSERVFDASLSFPSGHSSTVFYTMIFFILYIRYTWKCENSKIKSSCGFAILFAQCSMLTLAIFTAVSRVFDHKHHVTDVLAGSILGLSFAFFIFYLFTEFLSRKNNQFQLNTCRLSANSHGMNPATDDELVVVQQQNKQHKNQPVDVDYVHHV